jgi:4-amino-4-deoxy-L-arabinose transferase-like glycosyltransferase
VHQGLSRAALGLVVVCFCLPLFTHLGGLDLENDEAIYSFAVDRILESGDWLTPKSIPSDNDPFLEKPPLKMWMVAAPIRLGLLPHDEFGLRFVDAVLGSALFVYTFLIAARLSNPLGGVVAALMLFVHLPLLVLHGLRTNNMEAPLALAYAGGVYHWLAWREAGSRGRRRGGHVAAVAGYFVLGFMTKFVAALFLPLVLVMTAAVNPQARRALIADRRGWLAAAGVAAVLVVPWFVYEHIRYGAGFWTAIFGAAVYQRFTASLDPRHLQPWYFYATSLYQWFDRSGLVVPVAGGLILLTVEAFAWRRDRALLVWLWFVVPMTLISLGTSKLYHYAYPFLAPLAVAGGCFVAFVAALAQGGVDKALERPGLLQVRGQAVQRVLGFLGLAALALGAVTAIYGPVKIGAGGYMLLKNGGVVRPLAIGTLCLLLGGRVDAVRRFVVLVAVLAVLPTPAYRETFTFLSLERHPLRDASACIARVTAARASAGAPAPGLYVDLPSAEFKWPLFYYLRRVRPWEQATAPDADGLSAVLHDARYQRPILMNDDNYRQGIGRGAIDKSTPLTRLDADVLLLFPGPYAPCGANAQTAAPS